MLAPNPNLPPRYATPALYEFSHGSEACAFIETFCHVQKDSFAGKAGGLIELRSWQRHTITDLLECDENGRLRFRTGLIGLPKKNGKSLLGSCLAIYFLLTGGHGAEVYSVAASKEQARIVFAEAAAMVKASPELSAQLTVQRNVIVCESTNSVYRVLSADVATVDGLNPTAVICDEIHRWASPEMWDLMVNAISTRPNAIVLGITTAGYDRRSLCWRLYEYGKRVSSGETEDPTFFLRWWEAPPDASYMDPGTWASCNPGIGDFQSADDFASAARTTPENDFRRLRLNQWTKTFSHWLKPGAWEECTKADYRISDGASVVLGFDGSWSNDSTALVAVERDTLHVQVIDAWEKPPGDDDWRVEVADVEEAIRVACERFTVSEVLCDPAFWKASLQKLAGEGLPMVEVPQSIPRAVEATKAFEDAVYEQRLSHDGDPRLARHIDNCVVKTDRRTDGRYITKGATAEKIDLAMAAVMAVARVTTTEAPKPKRRPRVYYADEFEDAAA